MKTILMILGFILIIIGCNNKTETKNNTKQIIRNDLSLPNWIKGSWHNSYESLFKNFFYWSFKNDSIFFGKALDNHGTYSDIICLNKKYNGYNISKESNDSTYQLQFSKGKDTINFDFKLNNSKRFLEPVLELSFEGININESQTFKGGYLTKLPENK